MTRTIILALIILMSASFNTAEAKKKKDKNEAATAHTILNDAKDSLDYAAGVAQSFGLIRYIEQQYGVDTAQIGEFVHGYRDAVSRGVNNDFNAYVAGMQVAITLYNTMLPGVKESLAAVGDTAVNMDIFNDGFTSAVLGTAIMADSTVKKLYDHAVEENKRITKETNTKAGEEFLAANKLKEGVVTTASGLQYKVLVEGTGKTPSVKDEVTVKYEGRLLDGTVFDSSYKRKGETAKFRVNQVIKGWTEALKMMPMGSKWELYIPYDLAYGSRKAGNIPPYSTLIFIVELVSF